MVQSMWLVNNENNEDAWQWPQHEMADLVSDKRLMNEEAAKPLQKRWNSSLIGQWELGRQPLFFKETDPQPRKHTLWQATTDFTNGESMHNIGEKSGMDAMYGIGSIRKIATQLYQDRDGLSGWEGDVWNCQ
ncbi:hypothetical protein Tco_0707851 [Tanacetum coccineum]